MTSGSPAPSLPPISYELPDTIAAIATAPGVGSIGVVRISGPEAFAITDRVIRARRLTANRPGHALFRARIHDLESGAVVDDGLIAVFHAPRSLTGENVIEFQGHGGPLVLKQVFALFLQAGARVALPGEFSERAFASGKLDLAQAEAIADLISAQTDAAARAARRQLDGELTFAIESCTGAIQEALAFVEASIDFPEEIGDLDTDRVQSALARAQEEISQLLQGARYGRRLRDGVTLALVGTPNAGKSSLLNALAGTEYAIVTPHAGTTRDVLEAPIQIAGMPLRAWDTAGLRATEDPIEAIGIERARRARDTADIVVVVVDATAALSPDVAALLHNVGKRCAVVALNKADLVPQAALDVRRQEIVALTSLPVIAVSALTRQGFTDLRNAIVEALTGAVVGDPLVTSARHEAALQAASESLTRAQTTLVGGLPAELIAVDAHAALQHLGEITGKTAREDIIRGIFSRFCLGK